MPDALDAPFHPRLLRIYASSVLFYTIVYVLAVVLPVDLAQRGASATFVGVVGGLNSLAAMAVRPLAGRWIDRFGARPVFVGALSGMALSTLLLLLPGPWALAGSRVAQGVATATFSTSLSMITVLSLSARARGEGMSVYSLSTILPSTYGPALGLYLLHALPASTIFALVALIAAVDLAFGARLAVPARGVAVETATATATSDHDDGPPRNAARVLWAASAIILLASTSVGALTTFLPLRLGTDRRGIASTFFLVKALVMVTGRFLGRRSTDPSRSARTVAVSLVAAAIAPALLLARADDALVVLCAALHGFAFASLYPALLTTVSFAAPPSKQGLSVGLFIGAADLGVALGSLALGPVVQRFGYGAMFGVVSAAAAAGLALSALARPAATGARSTG